jgi:hypothetical protein
VHTHIYISYAEQLCLLRTAPSRAHDPIDRLIGRVKSTTNPNQTECIIKIEFPGPRSPPHRFVLAPLLSYLPIRKSWIECDASPIVTLPCRMTPIHPSRLLMHPPRRILSLYRLSLTRRWRVVTADH